MKIAVDAMGGDNAPEQIVKGVAAAREALPDVEFILYGKKMKLLSIWTTFGTSKLCILTK